MFISKEYRMNLDPFHRLLLTTSVKDDIVTDVKSSLARIDPVAYKTIGKRLQRREVISVRRIAKFRWTTNGRSLISSSNVYSTRRRPGSAVKWKSIAHMPVRAKFTLCFREDRSSTRTKTSNMLKMMRRRSFALYIFSNRETWT